MGQGSWTLTTPNFQKEIAPVNMKIYRSPTVAHNCHGKTKRQGKTNSTNGKTKLIHGRTKLIYRKIKLNHGKTKLNHGKTKFTHGKTEKTSWSAVVQRLLLHL